MGIRISIGNTNTWKYPVHGNKIGFNIKKYIYMAQTVLEGPDYIARGL